ncbi:MAG: sigma-70 family RNA polymerase sigma factor [Candidatus Aenigmatarchaeota archaeon]|nr:MAG: sigma-70 family RNA polymerase sigma factor [Candidatus Aenigmarchaeota archaeon]
MRKYSKEHWDLKERKFLDYLGSNRKTSVYDIPKEHTGVFNKRFKCSGEMARRAAGFSEEEIKEARFYDRVGLVNWMANVIYKSCEINSNPSLPPEDLAQEALIKLFGSLKKNFDPSRGVKVSSYAKKVIRSTAERANKEQTPPIHVPVNVWDNIERFKRGTRELSFELQRQPYNDEVAEKNELSPSQAKRMLESISIIGMESLDDIGEQPCLSFDRVNGEPDDPEGLYIEFSPEEAAYLFGVDISEAGLPVKSYESCKPVFAGDSRSKGYLQKMPEDPEDIYIQKEFEEIFLESLLRMNPRHATAVKLHICDGYSFGEIGKTLPSKSGKPGGITPEGAKQNYVRGLKKLACQLITSKKIFTEEYLLRKLSPRE